ncbi:MAG: helix-turn-helix transcriptional regulator [Ruminococcus sp.]|jgi:AraC family transcriptional regulator of arabinose operon|nr:helix-turn-helix transcriptional regulator [Ruminococcus sp.]
MDIKCVGCGSVYSTGYSVSREPSQGEYMLLLTRSRTAFTIEGVRAVVPEGTMILYNDTVRREYAAEDAGMICDWVCFTPGSDAEFLDSLELMFNRPFRTGDPQLVSGLIRSIGSEFYSLSSRRTKMLDSLMRLLLVNAEFTPDRRQSGQQTAEPHYSSLIDLRAKIYRNPQLKWNVDTMAADVNMSRSYLQHIYREVFGVSCISDVINGKIEKAKEILSETSCTVSQVASMCGYDNEEHFMRQFKKIVGMTPTRYRKST